MSIIKQIREKTAGLVDTVGRTKDGHIMVRRSFFYTHGRTASDFAKTIEHSLRPMNVSVVDFGEQWKAFSGGASVAQGSHWWAKVKVND